jgi:lipooligosaccharide transport system ATP-binding protein
MNVLRARALRKRYGGADVVSGLDLDVRAGECFGLLGPNGAGKTTTLRLCLGLTHPDGGEIELLGEPVPARAREARARVGVVPQFDNLDPDFTVAENLQVFARYFSIDSVDAKLPQLLDFAGLAGRGDARITALSGGMKRRLTLARALINDPQLLVLDEPTTGLDPQARHLVWERLYQLKRRGVTLVLTTHYMDEAEQLCDRLVIMDGGVIVAEGSPRQLIAEHSTREVVELRFVSDDDRAKALALVEGSGQPHEALTDRILIYTADGEREVEQLAHAGVHPESVLVRRSSLEDVFLRLTGRTLEE